MIYYRIMEGITTLKIKNLLTKNKEKKKCKEI